VRSGHPTARIVPINPACAATQSNARRSGMNHPSWADTRTSNAPSSPLQTKTIITSTVIAWTASEAICNRRERDASVARHGVKPKAAPKRKKQVDQSR